MTCTLIFLGLKSQKSLGKTTKPRLYNFKPSLVSISLFLKTTFSSKAQICINSNTSVISLRHWCRMWIKVNHNEGANITSTEVFCGLTFYKSSTSVH